MSFNRRGPDRRPNRPDRPDRFERDNRDRPPRRSGDYPQRDRPSYPPRDRGADRPSYSPRGEDRSFASRPRFDRGAADEGGMSIRLDPRRLGALKQLAAEADVRPGELVRHWVEERIDAARRGGATVETSEPGLTARLEDLAARVAALERSSGSAAASGKSAASAAAAAPESSESGTSETPDADQPKRRGRPRKSVSATPKTKRVSLHDEIIAVIGDRGPLSAADLAAAIGERGQYTAPRSGKPLDAAMVNGRVSNPTYRSRFTRSEGRIGLAEG